MTSSTSSTFPPWLCAAARSPSAPSLPGLRRGSELLHGRFVIGRVLGSGGMGVVYRALDRQAGEYVALKTLAHVKPSAIYRLKLEYRALADVRHPNLVRMHGLFEDQGRWCLIMQLVEGETLARTIERSPSIDMIRGLFTQIACGLSAIHAAGRIHRDLTPHNVMVTPEGRAVIMDFGLVSEQGLGVPGQTVVDGQVSGTPGYLSPEQASGRIITPESDWYAFGVMLCESLGARLPLRAVTRSTRMNKQLEEPLPAFRDLSLSEDLEQLCSALLECQPERRASESAVHAVLEMPRRGGGSSPPRTAPPSRGRHERELEQLRCAYLATDEDQAVVVWLTGPVASGKTTLARAFLEDLRLREDAVVLTGRCDPRESLRFRALDGIVDALSRHLRSMTRNEALYVLPRGVEELCRLFPTLGRIDGLLAGRPHRSATAGPRADAVGVAALKELLRRLAAHRPLVLHIDDLDHGDLESAQLLAQLLAPIGAPSLLLIASARTESGATGTAAAAFAAALQTVSELAIREIRLPSRPDTAPAPSASAR